MTRNFLVLSSKDISFPFGFSVRGAAFLPMAAVFLAAFFFFANAREGGAYENFLDVPGVTEEEADAIERLRRSRASFVFGVTPSTECFVRQDGKLDGFTVLFCDWLSQLFGIPFKPDIYEWNELLRKIASREVDFNGELTSAWMTTPVAERSIKYMVLSGNRSLAEIARLRRVRYVFLEGATIYWQTRPILDGPFDVDYAENYEKAYQKLKNGEADAFIDDGPFELAFDAYADVVVKDLLPPVYAPVFLATRNPELAPVISVVQKAMNREISSHLAELYTQGYKNYVRSKFFAQLTPEEAEYIRAHGAREKGGAPVKFAAKHDSYPAVFYNEKEKAWQGCALDILSEIEALSGLRFVQVHQESLSWPETARMLETGEIDLVSEFVKTGGREDRVICPDIPYMTDRYALISRSDTPDFTVNNLFGAKVGLVRGSASAILFRQWFPGHTDTVECADDREAVDALEQGRFDLFMGTENYLLSLSRYMEKPNFKANIIFERTCDSFFGVNKNETALCSILNKSLKLIDVEFIANRWKNRVFAYQWALARARVPLLAGMLVLAILAAVLLLILLFKNERARALEVQTAAARAASEAKSGFLARMSHEMRTPLNVIIGMGELALRERENISPPSVAEYVSRIGQAGHNLLSIINDVLDFSKIESGLLQLEDAPYRMTSLLDDVINVIRARAAEQRLLFLADVNPGVPDSLRGDSARLSQILINLLGNAVKYTREGFIRLTVDAAAASENSITLRFSVSDSGIGIKPENMGSLFRDFVRLDMKYNSGIEGTGLGLSISQNLCRAMGGDISATSVYGKGSEFVVTVPQIRESADPIASVSDRGKLRVLLYHKRDRCAESVARTLQSLGVAFRRAGDPSEFLLELGAGGWSHVFASAPEADQAVNILGNDSPPVKTVLLMDIGEAFSASKIDSLMMPIWTSPVANALEGKVAFERKKSLGVRFTAPRAKILVVDDLATNLQVAKGLLSPYHVITDACVNGAEAVELVQKQEYDMVLMDHMMPEMDGLEATKRIRALGEERFEKLPIIALTANAMSHMREMFLANGFNDFLAKPLEISKLNEIMERWIPPEKREKDAKSAQNPKRSASP
jgi:signal transduction histidine kinase/FixJ family two-component response regulator